MLRELTFSVSFNFITREPADVTFASLEHGQLDCLLPPITSWENSFLHLFFPYNLAHGRPQAGTKGGACPPHWIYGLALNKNVSFSV